MKLSIKDFFSKSDQIHSFLRIWSHLLKKSFMENFIFSAVYFFESIYQKKLQITASYLQRKKLISKDIPKAASLFYCWYAVSLKIQEASEKILSWRDY